MKPLYLALVVLAMSLPTMPFAQSTAHTLPEVAPSDAQRAFDQLKTLAGSWVGQLTTTPADSRRGREVRSVLAEGDLHGQRTVHEMSVSGRPDHPVTMFYRDEARLLLTHYCDAGNRPRMVGKVSPDGKTLDFEFLDLSGGNQHGHMHHAAFTFIDENHHVEDWTYMMPGDKPVRAHFDLQRTNSDTGMSTH